MSFNKGSKGKKERHTKIIVTILWLYFSIMAIFILHYVRRVFVAERFFIPTSSMSPTLDPGDHIWVNKLLFGARIYKRFDFVDHAPLECIRMPGLRKIRPNDIVIFNHPFGYDDWNRIEFKINHVCCKRVAGTPGDTLTITNSITHNSNYDGIIGRIEKQEQLDSITDSALLSYICNNNDVKDYYSKIGINLQLELIIDSAFLMNQVLTAIPLSLPTWTIKNAGPLYVPAQGDTVELTDFNRELYWLVIQYETGSKPTKEMKQYTFKQNYYFMLGDNSCDSQDSRYFGFVPEDFIVGIVGGRKVRKGLSAE